MATYISNGSGDWTTIPWLTAATGSFGPTAPAASSPPSGGRDKIVIRSPHVVTYNISGTFGDGGNGNNAGTTQTNILNASIILSGGRLRASRTQNTALTAVGLIWVDRIIGSFLDWGTLNDPVSAVTSSISLSSFTSTGIYVNGSTTSTTLGNSACFCGLEKTRNTFLTLSAAANDNTITVDNAFNWAIGDELVIESDTIATSRSLTGVRIQGFSGVDNKTITISPNLNFARLSGTRVGNFTSTVLVETVRSSTLTFGIMLLGMPNSIFQFSDMTVKDFGHYWRDTSNPANNVYTVTNACITYDAQYNLIHPIFRRVACMQTRSLQQTYGSISIFNPARQESLIEDHAYYSNPDTRQTGLRLGSNSIITVNNYVCYRGYNAIFPNSTFRATINNSYLNSENINVGSNVPSAETVAGNSVKFVNCKIKSNNSLSLADNLAAWEFINCDISTSPTIGLFTPTPNAFGVSTLRNCTLSAALPTTIQGSNRTVRSANLNIFNPNNDNTFKNFNSYHYAESNTVARKNGIRSLSFTPRIANENFEKVFTVPAVQGVTQKIKGNLRFDSNYGTANPPSITFGGAVNSTTFTCPAVVDTWHSFEYDLTPNSTSDIEVKIIGQSTNTNGFIYIDGLIFDPFISDVRWYGFEVDKNFYRTVDSSTTLTENQVSAYPYINNLDLVYDEARYWTVTNPSLTAYTDLVQKVGRTLDFSNRGILLDNLALSSLNFNSSTNLLTLSTQNLSAGNNFNAIQTTGGITINDNSNVTSITLIGSVSGDTARNLNNVIIDGTLTYNTNTDNVITYTNCNIGTVQNNGSGTITINRLNSNVNSAGRNVVLLENPTYVNISQLNGGYIAIFDDNNTLRYYRNTDGQILLPNGSTGVWTYKIGRYQSKVISGSFSVGGTVNITPLYIQDLNVLEENVNTVSSYNLFRNTQQIYDYFSFYMTTSAALSYPTFYNYRTILDITNKDLILNPSASIPFAYDGSTFTIKSQNLENGSVVRGVETTGNIYLSGSASLSAINIISNKVNSESVIDLKSVNATSNTNIVYNTDSNSSIVYTNCTIAKVENLGSGDIRIKKINSTITDGTDDQISDYYPTYLNLSLNAGTIAIYDSTQIKQYFVSSDQIIELPYEADGTWTYRATRYGRRTVDGNFIVNKNVGNTFDIIPTYQPDINIIGTLNSVSAYSTFKTIQNVYDYMSYYKTTYDGIDYGDLTNVGSILDIGNRSLTLDISSPSLFSVTSNNLTLSTNSLSAGDGSNVNSIKTNDKIFLSGSSILRGIGVQGSINQETISDLFGMTVDGTIRYKVDTPTNITYTNCNINNVINDGGSLVTITRINSTVINETDNEVETVVPISININVDNDTYVAIYKPDGSRYAYEKGNKTLVLGGDAETGNWSYKVAKYGYDIYSSTFSIDKEISSVTTINPILGIDSAISEPDVNTVMTYTNLNTVRKIYDYLSYYKTTSVGIDYGDIVSRSFDSIFFTKALTFDANATNIVDVISDVLIIRTPSLNENITIYSTGDFNLLNSAIISYDVKIRASNMNSEIILVGINKIVLYPTSNNRDTDTSKGPEITDTLYRFKYGNIVDGVTLSGSQYSRVDIGSILLYDFVINTGTTNIDLGTFGQIQQLITNQIVINNGVKKASRLIPHSTDL